MTYQLAPYTRAGTQNGVLYFGFGSLQRAIKNKSRQKLILRAAALWLKPKTETQLSEELRQYGFRKTEISNAISFLLKNHFLIQTSQYDRAHRYSRNHLFYSMSGGDSHVIQEKLAQKHVVIMGCGGIGNIIGVNLCTAGIGKLTLVDKDTIEASNLTRQILFKNEDVGQSKVEVLARELKKRNPDAEICVQNSYINQYEDLNAYEHADLIILSADADDIAGWVNRFSFEKNVPFLNVGYVEDVAVWGPFVIPGRSGCLACQDIMAVAEGLERESLSALKEINRAYQAPSIGPTNMTSAALATLDVIKYFGEFGEIQSLNRRVGIWTHDLNLEFQSCAQNPDCKVCAGGSQP